MSDACQYEYRHLYVMPGLEERFKPVLFKDMAAMARTELNKMFEVAYGLHKTASSVEMMELGEQQQPATLNGHHKNGELKKEKLLMMTFVSMLSISTSQCNEPHVLEFMPVFAHYANDNK